MAGVERVLFFALTRSGETVTLGLLGLCGDLRVERLDQKPDWLGLPAGIDSSLSGAHAQSAAHTEIAIALEHAGVSCHRCSMAHPCCAAKSEPGRGQRLPLVLFRQ
jgi:hypothetical protein